MKFIGFENVNITGGFWKDQQDVIRNATIHSVYRRFKDTGRFDAIKMNWQEGMPNRPHVYWDSDVAKWIEALAYLLEKASCDELEAKADEMIEDYAFHQLPEGYINSCIAHLDREHIFTDRSQHELYTIGHLTEAAIAYHKHTGKRKLLDCMEKCLDFVYDVFLKEKRAAFVTPGHEEIELALIKLYRYTGNGKYLEMAKFFIDNRGLDDKGQQGNPGVDPKYSQSHLPVREQTTAEGHAVRAVYLYTAMAELAAETGDEQLLAACQRILSNIVEKRMYITGGIGSTANGEAFTKDYDLPNITAYTESCAAIGLIFFASRLQLSSTDTKYADLIEKILYNGLLSGKALDGKAFFYENPLEIPPASAKMEGVRYPITQRLEVFDCSCCPPNIARFIASVGNYVYAEEDGELYIHQYMTSEVRIGEIRISQETNYPLDGRVKIKCVGGNARIALRVPAWSERYQDTAKDGYLRFRLVDGAEIEVDFDPRPSFVCTNPNVLENIGRAALTYGPLVFCLEEVDNGPMLRALRFSEDTCFRKGFDERLGVLTFIAEAERLVCDADTPLYVKSSDRRFEKTEAKFIPYYAFANRGESEMLVFVPLK